MTFGDYLRQLREKKALRQADLAKIIKVSTVYICDIEKGRRNPPDFEKLRIWVGQMELSPDEISCLYDLAGAARNSVAPDILEYLDLNPAATAAIRRIMGQQKEYDWDRIPTKR